jgi:hypothetical protein
MEQAHIKMTGQTDNEHLGISFIYHWYSFLLSLLFTIGIAFYCEMRRRMFTMGML